MQQLWVYTQYNPAVGVTTQGEICVADGKEVQLMI
jgi:hypothetical protein